MDASRLRRLAIADGHIDLTRIALRITQQAAGGGRQVEAPFHKPVLRTGASVQRPAQFMDRFNQDTHVLRRGELGNAVS